MFFSQIRGKIMRKSRVFGGNPGNNVFTHNRPSSGVVFYIQIMLESNNWVLTNAKSNPKIENK